MALSRFVSPFADVGSGIKPSDGAKLFFYETGTTTFSNTYNCPDGTTANANPVIADANGVFPDIFFTGTFKVVLKDKNNNQIWEGDPVNSFVLNANGEVVKSFDTLALAVADTGLVDGDFINLKERSTGNGGGAEWNVVDIGTVTPDTFEFVAHATLPLALVLQVPQYITPQMWGLVGDGSNEIAGLQSLFFSQYRDRIVGRGNFKIESTLKIRSETRCIGWGDKELKIYTDVDRNINLVQGENLSSTAGVISTGIWLENMEFDHNRLTDFTSETLMTILLVGCKNVRLKRIKLTNPNTDGIYISDSYGGTGNALNLPENIIIEDLECTGDHHNRNGISVIAGKNITMRDHTYTNITRKDMPGTIDLEPNNITQFVTDVLIENITLNNCKQGIISDFVADKTNTNQIRDITIRDIVVNGTPVQDDGPYSEFGGTSGVAINRATNVTIDNITVTSANSVSMLFQNVDNITVNSPTVKDGRSHGIVFQDCTDIKLDNYNIECVNGVFNSVKTAGIYMTFRAIGVGHPGCRGVAVGTGTVNLIEAAITDTSAFSGAGNIKDVNLSGMIVKGNWEQAAFQGDASSGWPNNWTMEYTLDESFTGAVAKFGIVAGQTVNGKWRVPGFTNGITTITTNTDKFVATPFRVNNQSVFSCSLTTSNAEPCSVNTNTAGNIQLLFPSSTTATIYWELERP